MTNSARALLEPVIDSKKLAGIFSDFDGTLAEFVVDPRAVIVSDPLQALFDDLPLLYALVAIVSARDARQLAEKVHARSVVLAGQNGAQERLPDGSYTIDPELAPWIVRASAWARALLMAGPLWRLLGMTVEGKLTTVSLHYRAARWIGLSEALCRLVGWVARRRGFAPVLSQMELEIKPAVSMDKGEWVKRTVVATGLKMAVYIGDGANDLAAFAAIRDLVKTGVLTHGVCFAVDGEETPRTVLDAADAVLPGIPGVTRVLEMLAGKGGA